MKDKLSKHFKRSEFACKCGCGQDTVDYELLSVLETLHSFYGTLLGKCYIKILSGNRCKKHNAETPNASKYSKHINSKACDFAIYYLGLNGKKKYIDTEEIYCYLIKKYPKKYGIIRHKTFVHLDVREIAYHKI